MTTPWPAKLRSRTIIGLYKTEVIRPRGPWRGLEAVEFATLDWVDWFNNRRILEPIGNREGRPVRMRLSRVGAFRTLLAHEEKS